MKRLEKYSVDFIDPWPIYKTLKKYYTPITCEHLLEITSDEKLREYISDLEKNKGIKENAYSAFIFLPLDIHAVFSKIRRNVVIGKTEVVDSNGDHHLFPKNFCSLGGSDAYADIKIYNATYAYMWCGDWDRFKSGRFYNGKMDLQKINGYHTFPDITYENPLIAPYGSPYSICTDGTEFEYLSIYMSIIGRDSVRNSNYNYAITHFPSLNGILFAGNAFQYSFSCDYNEITNVPNNQIIPK